MNVITHPPEPTRTGLSEGLTREGAAHYSDGREPAIYPVIFRIGEYDITSFGVLVAIAALAGIFLFDGERRRSGLPDGALDAAMAGVFGGPAGAKLVWALEHMGREGPFLELLFSRGGLSWFGGFAGGLGAGIVVLRWRLRHALVGPFAVAHVAAFIAVIVGIALLSAGRNDTGTGSWDHHEAPGTPGRR